MKRMEKEVKKGDNGKDYNGEEKTEEAVQWQKYQKKEN